MMPVSTYLLTWNPAKYSWDDIDNCIHEISVHGHFNRYWSCGRSKKLRPGDRFFLLRQKIEPRGIVASGYVTSEPYKDDSIYNTSGWSRYVKLVYDVIRNPEKDEIISRQRLNENPFANFHWDAQGSGITIPHEIAQHIEKIWEGLTGSNITKDKDVFNQYVEGARQQVYLTSYERNPKARTACLNHRGYSCVVCGFNFEKFYGELGRNFIHVHHLIPLSEIKVEYVVNPIEDMCPVCPNCHAMLHRQTDEGFISIEQLKNEIEKAPNNSLNRSGITCDSSKEQRTPPG